MADAVSDRSAILQAKKAIRSAILQRRDALDEVTRSRASALITARLLDLPQFQNARYVLAYLSFGTELETDPFIQTLRARGCALALPKVDRETRRLEIYRVADPLTDTVAGVWGIREPDPSRCERARLDDIDAVLVPGVAFTPACDRLGYGGGFYDGLIGNWPARPRLIAGAYDVQVVAQVPMDADDQPIDCVVTESSDFSRSSTTR
ncbi:MAG: 5-formyltetrahydrofolate cyclo-ligase [Betaproteobacteria bacterium]